MCYPVCGMVHIKDPLLLFKMSNPCSDGSRFHLLLSEWFFTIYLPSFDTNTAFDKSIIKLINIKILLNSFFYISRKKEGWVVGSILHGGPIELFLIPASASH